VNPLEGEEKLTSDRKSDYDVIIFTCLFNVSILIQATFYLDCLVTLFLSAFSVDKLKLSTFYLTQVPLHL